MQEPGGQLPRDVVRRLARFYRDSDNRERSDVKVWTGRSQTTSGVATFYPTETNTAGGKAIFNHIFAVIPAAWLDTGDATLVPWASVKTVAANKKSITINVVRELTVTFAEESIPSTPHTIAASNHAAVEFAADGTKCFLVIIGD